MPPVLGFVLFSENFVISRIIQLHAQKCINPNANAGVYLSSMLTRGGMTGARALSNAL